MFGPTDTDRERLEVLNERLHNLRNECSCGPRDGCDECGGKGISEDFYVVHHNADTLELTLRLKDLDPRSKLARRMVKDTDFAAIAHRVNDLIDRREDAEEVQEAAELLAEMRYPNRDQEYAELED